MLKKVGFIRRDGPEGGLCLKEGVMTLWWKPGRGGEERGGEEGGRGWVWRKWYFKGNCTITKAVTGIVAE